MIALITLHARTFWRDRAGVLLAFLLPPVIYLLFAAIFGAPARGDLDLSVAVFQARDTPISRDIAAALGPDAVVAGSRAELEDIVLRGEADAGVLIGAGEPAPAVVVLASPGRPLPADMTARAIEKALDLRTGAPDTPLVTTRTVGPAGDMQAVYYAGAVSVMFLFFSAAHGALGALDDRRSGLTARLRLLAGHLTPIVGARLLWLTAVGVLQALAVFAVAAPRLPGQSRLQLAAWLITVVLSAAAASGLSLAVVSLCRTREQAQPLTTFLVLLLAAVGGSMAPRFLMPEAFRALGWLTPHAWAIEAYQGVLSRGRIDDVVMLAWAVLAATAIAGGWVSLVVEDRRRGV